MKQRLVGAAVLLSLAVIFVPVLMEPEDRQKIDHASQIPAAPEIAPVEIAEPVDDSTIPPVRAPQDMYDLEQAEPEPAQSTDMQKPAPAPAPVEAPVKPRAVNEVSTPAVSKSAVAAPGAILDEKGVPNAWVVQVASFNSEERALALKEQLITSGFPAFNRTSQTSQGVISRVYVGPKVSRDEAQRVKAQLDAKLGLKTMVISFKPH